MPKDSGLEGLDLMDDCKTKVKDMTYIDEDSGGCQKATKRQRGYIHGLCDKLDFDESELPYDMADITLAEAADLIEQLKDNVDAECSGWGVLLERRIGRTKDLEDNELPFF